MYFFSSSLELSVSWYIHNSISLHIYYQEPVPRYNVTLPPSIADVSKRKWVGGGGGYIILKAVKRTGWITPYQSFVPTHPVHLKWCGRKTTVCLLDQRGVEVQIRIEILSRGYLWPWDTFVLSHPCFELSLLTSYLRFWAAYAFSYQYFYLAIPMLLAIYAFELPTLLRCLCFELLCLWPTYVFRLLCWQATHAFGLPMLLDYLCTQASYVF